MKALNAHAWFALSATLVFHFLASADARDQSIRHSTTSNAEVIAVDTNELPTLAYDAGLIKFIALSKRTGGTSAVVELTEMPGYKTAWHQHNNCEEAFYVLEGVLTIKIVDKNYTFPAGSYVLIPRGTPHGQGNFSQKPLKLLTTFTPGGFDVFFEDRVELFKRTKPGDPDFQKQFDELRARHSQWVQILGAWEPGK